MITTSLEEEYATKQAGSTGDGKNPNNAPFSSSNTWSRLRDPRVVRVSRSFGGKDRHSKVCTVRGLRDRRVRLSVPTAIQLYDLQDRLGVNQPSKVVDWLLNAAKHEIDELPPLQMPPGNLNFGHNFQELMLANNGVIGSSSHSSKEGNNNSSTNWDNQLEITRSNFWNSDATMREKSKEVAEEEYQINEKEDEAGLESDHGANVSITNFFPRANHPSVPGLLNNIVPNYNSFFRRDAPNFSVPHFHGYTLHREDSQNPSIAQFPPNLVLPSGSHQSYFPFPSHVANPMEFDSKQINHFQMSSFSSQNPLSNSPTPTLYSIGHSIHLGMAPRSDKDHEFPPK
ncbi:hypothetical protein NMG60_11006337 [Bertholletia excelsa]